MTSIAAKEIIHNSSPSVKSYVNPSLTKLPEPMIHHKTFSFPRRLIISYKSIKKDSPYGVSRSQRVITPSLFLKKYDRIRDCLQYALGLSCSQREVTLRLLRLWAYYGLVYPKESQITEDPGCSKATYWRTIRLLKDLGLIRVINRYVCRPHAQISNLYRLDKLAVMLARYLAEHGTAFLERWLQPALAMPGQKFWSLITQTPGDRAGPEIPVFEGF